ncbi:hypothetical protein HPB50_028461 [Hyalomma asiaticum]|nr:hypothetical protein HPB50_028461 [Hyalomma asiaticum]
MPAGARACSEASRNSASFYCSDSSAIDMDGGSRKPRPPYHVGGTRPRRGWFHCGYQRPPPGFHDPKGAAYMRGYGMGYQLCENSTGVVFNGNTRVILLNNTKGALRARDVDRRVAHRLHRFSAGAAAKIVLPRQSSQQVIRNIERNSWIPISSRWDQFRKFMAFFS